MPLAEGPLFAALQPESPARAAVPQARAPHPQKAAAAPVVFSVSELAARVKSQLEGEFGKVTVQAEVSGGKLHSSGHFYCDLKDEGAVLNAVAWRSTVARWRAVPANGTLVVATGRLTTYPQRSNYQLMVESLEPAGLGALMQQLEALREKLRAEGLFDAERKKPLPFLPQRIGIITSPTGAVIRDMLHRLADRCPRQVLLWPAAVQGAEAATQVAAAVRGFNALPKEKKPDVIIIARGGGSFEDLMPFNAEVLVRAVAQSAIPTISGVGHEPDFTLCDSAADVRAPTPSAAAELTVPVREDLLYTLALQQRRLEQITRSRLENGQERLEALRRLLPDPRRQVLQLAQRLAELEQRLRHSGPAALRDAGQRLEGVARVLAAHNPAAPLQRGYVYLTGPDGAMLRSKAAPAGPVTVHFHDGTRQAELK